MAMAQQRMQQNMIGGADGNARHGGGSLPQTTSYIKEHSQQVLSGHMMVVVLRVKSLNGQQSRKEMYWKNILRSNVEDHFPAALKLEEEGRVLRDFHVVEVEVPTIFH